MNNEIDYYNEIIQHSKNNPSDISPHLPTIFKEISSRKMRNPELNEIKLIVELGVCTGQSTYVFDKINRRYNSHLVSIDIDNCNYENIYNGHFVNEDDITFANSFENYCQENNLPNKIDILFIDTSHYYEHTKQEIDKWFNFLNENALIIFHDTNMPDIYLKDGVYNSTWDNERGVIRGIEEYFNFSVFEGRPFKINNIFKDNFFWNFYHVPENNGLTFIYKMSKYIV
jgi:hypothetical protein